MQSKHQKTIQQIANRPTVGSVKWNDFVSLMRALGATFEERAGSRVLMRWNGDKSVFHRPHPGNELGKARVGSIRSLLQRNGVIKDESDDDD